MASVELVQPVERTWLIPRKPSAMEISLATMPTIDTGIAYGETPGAARRQRIPRTVARRRRYHPRRCRQSRQRRFAPRGPVRHRETPRVRPARRSATLSRTVADRRGRSRPPTRLTAPVVAQRLRRHTRGDAARPLRLELGNRADPADAARDPIPEQLAARTKRRYDTDTGDCDSRLGHQSWTSIFPGRMFISIIRLECHAPSR